MRNKVCQPGLLLGFFLILALVSSCASLREPAAPMFDPLLYPPNEFYIGTGIIKEKDRGKAKQAAKLLAITDLASQIQTTIVSKKEASLLDDGHNQNSTFKELIEETLYQEFENILYIEEDFSTKQGQTTYAIINRTAWELQKARKILIEREHAQTILSERYPDISLAREISILNAALASLRKTTWGTLVQGKFDDSYGFLLSLVMARRNLLVTRAQHSNLYHISNGFSTANFTQAKENALQHFQVFLAEKLYREYEKYRIIVSSPMPAEKLKAEIDEHIAFSFAQNSNLLEYFEAPDSTEELFHMVLLVEKIAWEEQEQRKYDMLYQQVYPFFQSYSQAKALTDQILALNKIKKLLATSCMGLVIEEQFFPQQKSNKQSIELLLDQLIKSVDFSLTGPNSVQQGEDYSFDITLKNTRNLHTEIPVSIIISDEKGNQVYSQFIFMKGGERYTVKQFVPPGKTIQTLRISCYWTDYPQQQAGTSISVKKLPIIKRILGWFGK